MRSFQPRMPNWNANTSVNRSLDPDVVIPAQLPTGGGVFGSWGGRLCRGGCVLAFVACTAGCTAITSPLGAAACAFACTEIYDVCKGSCPKLTAGVVIA